MRRNAASVPVAAEQVQFDRQEVRSRGFDRGFLEGARLADLDQAVSPEVAAEVTSGMATDKALQYLGLADFHGGILRLRRAALLLFAKDVDRWHPRSQVRVLRVTGTQVLTGREFNVTSDDQQTGNVLALLQTSWDSIRPHLARRRLAASGLFAEQLLYPEDACREALTNAIAHHDYSIEGQGIEVWVFDDRIDVRSPGGLLSTVPIAALASGSGVHESRNTAIARVLRELGYMTEMGEGMRRIISLMKGHDLQPPPWGGNTPSGQCLQRSRAMGGRLRPLDDQRTHKPSVIAAGDAASLKSVSTLVG